MGNLLHLRHNAVTEPAIVEHLNNPASTLERLEEEVRRERENFYRLLLTLQHRPQLECLRISSRQALFRLVQPTITQEEFEGIVDLFRWCFYSYGCSAHLSCATQFENDQELIQQLIDQTAGNEYHIWAEGRSFILRIYEQLDISSEVLACFDFSVEEGGRQDGVQFLLTSDGFFSRNLSHVDLQRGNEDTFSPLLDPNLSLHAFFNNILSTLGIPR